MGGHQRAFVPPARTCRHVQQGLRSLEAARRDLAAPAARVQGENFNQVWRNDLFSPKNNRPISGPFIFNRWQRGSQLVLTRNPSYWGKRAYLNQIVYRVVSDTNTQFQAIRSGELNVLRPQPQLQIADARGTRTSASVRAGVRVGAHRHRARREGPSGSRPRVRPPGADPGHQPPAIASALYRTISPGSRASERHLQAVREGHVPLAEVELQPRGRRAAAPPNNCTKGSDGIYSCPQVGKLSFRFTSTAGNQLRELAFEVIQSQLKAVGIVEVGVRSASHVFGTVLPSRDWDLFMFTWIGSPTSPITDEAIHGCGGDQNDMEYCNQQVQRCSSGLRRS